MLGGKQEPALKRDDALRLSSALREAIARGERTVSECTNSLDHNEHTETALIALNASLLIMKSHLAALERYRA
jgi:hypothetical protein